MTATMTYVGLDVHARSTHAAPIDVASGEVRRARFGGGSEEVIRWLQALPKPVKGCYEAGPTGFALFWAAESAGLQLEVVAPSNTPRAPGDRIKSDRKDAELLARLLLAGQLRPVTVPTPAFEAARHLARPREQVRGDLMRCRHRVSKLLLYTGASTSGAPGRRRTAAGSSSSASRSRRPSSPTWTRSPPSTGWSPARQPWTSGSSAWPARASGGRPSPGCAASAASTRSRRSCSASRSATGRASRAPKLAGWLGLVPSLDQSGESRRQGAITKTGSGYAPRLLVEAAWHYLPRPSVGPTLADRRAGQPDHVLQIALRAQRRLNCLHERLRARGMPGNVTTVAVARELACFLWAAAVAD